MRRIALIISTLFIMKPVLAADTWSVDDAHSASRFKIKHLMISTVAGEVTGMKGKVDLDGKKVNSVDVTLDAKTLSTNNAKRDEHLRGPDFFDVKKYPTITFKSDKVENDGAKLKINGKLTLHGVTKDVTFDSEGLTDTVKDPWGNTRRALVATTKINRADYGIKWNKDLDGGGVVVGNDVDITVETELVAPKAGEPAKKPKG